MAPNLQNPLFTDDAKAREWLEAHVWPNGPVCLHCGCTGDSVTLLAGKGHRPGLYSATAVESNSPSRSAPYSSAARSVVEVDCRIVSPDGFQRENSAHQVHRSLGISYKSSWFMMHRLREAMRSGGLAPMGGSGKIVEADETYFGKTEEKLTASARSGKPYQKRGRGAANKRAILTLVERGGTARTFHVGTMDARHVDILMRANISREAVIHTDESGLYNYAPWTFAKHKRSNIAPTSMRAAT